MRYKSKDILDIVHELFKLEQNSKLNERFPVFQELSKNDITVLTMVANNPDIKLKDICITLELPKSTMTHVISRLERKGYLRRETAQQDLRSFRLSLTEKGVQADRQHLEYEKFILNYMKHALNENEICQLGELLQKLVSNVDMGEVLNH